jgi:hypothetical protein
MKGFLVDPFSFAQRLAIIRSAPLHHCSSGIARIDLSFWI